MLKAVHKRHTICTVDNPDIVVFKEEETTEERIVSDEHASDDDNEVIDDNPEGCSIHSIYNLIS